MKAQLTTLAVVLLAIQPTPVAAEDRPADLKARHFQFRYSAQFEQLPVGAKVRIWLPLPLNNSSQEAKLVSSELPADGQVHREARYGNRMMYVETRGSEKGSLKIAMTYNVRRREERAGRIQADNLPNQLRQAFLRANTKVPTTGQPLDLLRGLELPSDDLKLAQLLYDRVESHMRYDKSKPGYGSGDAVWACQSGFGNCTDFHSLFISLARSQKVPSRFTIGFPLPLARGAGDIGGYHCWAHFRANQTWLPVDISEADKHPELKSYYFGNLTENRVAFSVGRDLILKPRQAGPPLNYFIYPYVEADGRVHEQGRMKMKFQYRDLK